MTPGEIQVSGASTVTGTRGDDRGPSGPARSAAAMCRAAWRPLSAATSAVSAACTRLPGGEDPGSRGRAAPCPRPGRACPGRAAQAGQPRELVVGNPVPGEHHGVAREPVARRRSQVRELDRRQPRPGRDIRRPTTRVHTGTRQRTRGAEPERRVALLPRLLGDQRDDLRPGVRQGDHRREAHVLGADDDGARPGSRSPAQVHPLLQLAGGQHAGRPVAGDQAGRPRAAPGTRWPAVPRRGATVSTPGRLGQAARAQPPPRGPAQRGQPVVVARAGPSTPAAAAAPA